MTTVFDPKFKNWPGGVVTWAPSKRKKNEVHIFERANLSGFVSPKKTLIDKNRFFFIILELDPPRNEKFGLFSIGKGLYKKKL